MKIHRHLSLSLATAFVLALLSGCVDPPPGSESQIWQRPPRYGHGGTEAPPKLPGGEKKKGAPAPGGNRFGFGGDSAADPAGDPAGTTSATPPDRQRDTDNAAATNPEKPTEPKKPGGPPSSDQMPFAKGVPGKPTLVTLPPPYDKLGEVSIEEYQGDKPTGKPLPPGTPMAIPDPGNPGKSIYFRVP